MFSGLSTQGLARSSTQHPKRVIGIWIAILVLAFVSVGSFSTGTLTTEFAFFSNPDSKQGDALLADRLRGPANVNEVVIVRSNTVTVDDASYEEFVLHLQRETLNQQVQDQRRDWWGIV